jgi:ubiquinone biosynthesis protein
MQRPRQHTLRARADRLGRYAQLGAIVARSGLWRSGWRSDEKGRGRSLRQALEQAGGIYIKLGQFLSTRPDLVPADVAGALQLLQQDARAVPSSQVRQVFVEELGCAPSELLDGFDPHPVAAASVAQVHRARLADGSSVAVKVQRPDVAQRVHRDLDILGRLAAVLERRTDWAVEQRLSATVDGFAGSVSEELDFHAEARNLIAIATAVRQHERIVVPAPVATLSRRRVLVMEWIDGQPLSSGACTLAAEERRDLARILLRSFFDQIFTAGVFHADPHPGNIHLTRDGRIALLDCGAVGRLEPRQQVGLQALLVAIATHDATHLADAITTIAHTSTPDLDRSGLANALGRLLARHLRPGSPPDLALFVAFSEVLRDFGLALEPVVLGAIRALATLQTTIELLAADLDLLDEARAFGQDMFMAAA